MTSDRHQTAPFPPNKSFGQSQVDNRIDIIFASGVLGDTHAPNEDSSLSFGDHTRKVLHSIAADATTGLQFFPRSRLQVFLHLVESDRVIANEVLIHPSLPNHMFQGAVQKSMVAADAHLKELFGNLGTEQRNLHIGWNPIPIHGGLCKSNNHRYLITDFAI